MKPANFLPALLLAALALPGCASTGDAYPSLAKRDVERVEGTALPADGPEEPAPPPPIGPDLESRLSRLVADARAAHREFAAQRPAAARAISAASGSARAGEAWTTAQVALAGLDAARSKAMIALADLDLLHAGEVEAYPDLETPAGSAIAAARDEVSGLVAQEDEAIAALSRRIGT